MLKFMIHIIALTALLALAQNSLAIDKRDVNIFEVRNTCLSENGLPVPVGLLPAKPPKMSDEKKQAMLACFQSHGVDLSSLPPLK